MVKFLHYLRAEYRLLFGFCPQCNSDAPALYYCPVCNYYSQMYPPTKETKQGWRERWRELNK